MHLAFRYFVFSIFFGVIVSGFSQSEKPAVKVQGQATSKSIKLRWAPNSPGVWQLANKYGYSIERIALSENGKAIAKPVKILLNKTPLKPAQESAWTYAMDQDDNVAVAAQAIFGEDFEVAQSYSSEVMKVVNKAKELESRYSFALFACDQSIKAAELSGLYFEDETIAPATKYLYRVYTHIPVEVQRVDTGYVYVGLQDYKSLPKPIDLKAVFEDHMALLSWNGILFEKIYNSFWVERSEDGKNFKRITEQPVINAFQGEKPKSHLTFKTDSLPANDVRYYYRVIGINTFGETGPPSDTVSGFGKPGFAYSSSILNHEIRPDGSVKLQWSFPAEGESLLKSFDLLKVNQKNKVYTEVRTNINKNERSIVDERPSSTNYYVLRANDKYGRKNNSFPYLVQTEDSIPPLPPVELQGKIDTLGRVFLSWKANSEEDLLGYAVYKANFSTDEYVQKPGPIFTNNSYVDTIKLNNLTEKVYYKVKAIDKRFNSSAFSAVLILEKPDKIPPVPPVFKSIRSDSVGISIAWNFSDSEDVIEHLLYRKADTEHEWSLVKTIFKSDTTSFYKDISVKHRVNYAYTILAVDDDGLESIPAEPVSATYISSSPYPKVENIFYTVDKTKKSITVSWNYTHAEVDKFFIYKSNNGLPLKLFKSVDASVRELKDLYSINDTKVEYRIVVGFKNGDRTRGSKELVIKM